MQDGYESYFIANTQNLEGTFVFQADTEFGTSASVNSNGEIEGILPSESSELTVNAAASKSILRKPKYTIPRSSQMSTGAPAKLIANEQIRLTRPDGQTYGYMDFHATWL